MIFDTKVAATSLSSYRPHNPGHDYYAPGIYLITLVVRDRAHNATMFGTLNGDARHPAVLLSDVGRAVMECWEKIPSFQSTKGRHLRLHAAICMPDHFHGVIEVLERMDVSVGEVIRGFKAGSTMRWQELRAIATHHIPGIATHHIPDGADHPSMVAQPYLDERQSQQAQAIRAKLKNMSKRQRAEYYATHPKAQQPLWDDNYDDAICLTDPTTGQYSQRHFHSMTHYVEDNARRAIIRHLYPQFMQRCLHVEMAVTTHDGRHLVRSYAAFGNLFLLRWAKKVQIFCHRKARFSQLTQEELAAHGYTGQYAPDATTAIPYTETTSFRQEHDRWVTQVMAGATVLVTPGISPGELLMKNECLEHGYPLIHLQKEPIGRYWKPEARRFEACTRGSLLILAPWQAESLGDVRGVPSATDYSIFHNLNALAGEICDFDGEAVIKRW